MEQTSLISIYTGGALSLFLAIFHLKFPRIFRWDREWERISETNGRILYTIHMALLLLFFGFAFLSFVFARELSRPTGVALGIDIMYSLFWLWRTLWQVIYFKVDPTNRFRNLHYALINYFFLLAVAYALPVALTLFSPPIP